MVEAINTSLFLAINASAAPYPGLVALARLSTDLPLYLVVVIVAGLWAWGPRDRRGALLATGLGLGVSLALAFIIAALWHIRDRRIWAWATCWYFMSPRRPSRATMRPSSGRSAPASSPPGPGAAGAG